MVPSLEDRLGTESAPATHGWDELGKARVWGWASKHRWSCTAALRPSLPFAQRARGTLPYPDSSQWEPSPPLWAPHLPSLAGPHAPHLLSLACPLPWLCSATSMQVSVAHGQGAARGRVFEWAAWEGAQAHLSCMGTCAQQLHNHTQTALLNVMYPSRDRLLPCPRRQLSLCLTIVPPMVIMSHPTAFTHSTRVLQKRQSHPAICKSSGGPSLRPQGPLSSMP